MDIRQLETFCNLQENGMLAVRDSKVLFVNSALQKRYPNISAEDALNALLPVIIAKAEHEHFLTQARFLHQDINIQAAKLGDVFLYTILPTEKITEGAMVRSITSAMRRKLMALHLTVDQLSGGKLSVQQLQISLQLLNKTYYQLQRLCDNADYFFRLQDDDVSLQLKNVNLVVFMGDLVRTIDHFAKDMGFRVLFQTNLDNLETAIDVHKITKLLLNLFCNSMQVMSDGDKLRIQLKEQDKHVMINVTDTGPGMRTESLGHAPYLRDVLHLPPHAGVGLGIPVAHEIVKLHGGTMLIGGDEKKGGTNVIVRFPIQKIDATDEFQQEQSIYRESLDNIRTILMELSEVLSSDAYSKKYLD